MDQNHDVTDKPSSLALINELTSELQDERKKRATAEKAKKDIELELEHLTSALFEEANGMVATARRETESSKKAKRDMEQELEALTSALFEEANGMVSSARQEMQASETKSNELASQLSKQKDLADRYAALNQMHDRQVASVQEQVKMLNASRSELETLRQLYLEESQRTRALQGDPMPEGDDDEDVLGPVPPPAYTLTVGEDVKPALPDERSSTQLSEDYKTVDDAEPSQQLECLRCQTAERAGKNETP